MGLHVAQMTSQKGIRQCFDAVTVNAAKVMHLQGYGLEVGCDASFVLLQARDAVEAIRLRANRLKVWKSGKLPGEHTGDDGHTPIARHGPPRWLFPFRKAPEPRALFVAFRGRPEAALSDLGKKCCAPSGRAECGRSRRSPS